MLRANAATTLTVALLLGFATETHASRPISKVALALSTDTSRMHCQWVSAAGEVLGLGLSLVEYGASPRNLTYRATGYNWTFTDSNTKLQRFMHAATMTGLTPGGVYYYRVGDPLDGWSAVFQFVATRTAAMINPAAPLSIGWFGDLGWTNAQALAYIETEIAAGVYDHVVHVGDYAYDLQDSNGAVGDSFMDSISPLTSSVPYMGCEGNHEAAQNFEHYNNRFALFAMDNSSGLTPSQGGAGVEPGTPNNHWYSYSVGPVHFLVMSTEAYFSYTGYLAAQYAFMEKDLTAVDR